MPFSKGSSQHRDQTSISNVYCAGNQVLYLIATWETHIHIIFMLTMQVRKQQLELDMEQQTGSK